jgi:YhcH/YjgK/YiaL family protein
MIIDTLNHCEQYYGLGENFKKAFEFLKNNDISKMELGKHEIDGEDVFVQIMEYTTKTIDNCKFEAHKRYADIQYVREGFEYFGYAPIERASAPITEYDPEKDIIFFEKECDFVLLRENYFAVVFPHDLHMPQKMAVVPTFVRKAVVKVKM